MNWPWHVITCHERLSQLFLNRMFSLWDWFCSEKVYPQTRRAYYLFSYYYLFFTICM